MKNYWTKQYINGKSVSGHFIGTSRIDSVSWSQSSLDNIEYVELIYRDFYLKINGPCKEFWHSNTAESIFGNSNIKITKRRIMCKIDSIDKFYVSYVKGSFGLVDFKKPTFFEGGYETIITPNLYNKWIILELDIKNQNLSSFIKDNKY